jgi:hypothetical protein
MASYAASRRESPFSRRSSDGPSGHQGFREEPVKSVPCSIWPVLLVLREPFLPSLELPSTRTSSSTQISARFHDRSSGATFRGCPLFFFDKSAHFLYHTLRQHTVLLPSLLPVSIKPSLPLNFGSSMNQARISACFPEKLP